MSTRHKPDPTLQAVLGIIRDLTPRLIENRSGVSSSTIRSWRKGKVMSPQNKTLEFALRAAGYKRVIVKDDGKG